METIKNISELQKFLQEAKRDIEADFEGRVPDDMAYDLARSIVENTDGIEDVLQGIGVSDFVAYVADRL